MLKKLDFVAIIEVIELKVYTNSWLSECMNTYEYQRSRLLFGPCQRSLRFLLSNIFCCEASVPIEAEFHEKMLKG